MIRTPNRGFGIRLPHHRQPGQTGAPGRIRTGTVRFLRPLSLPVGLQAHGRLGRIRTDTGHGLSVLPLPSWATSLSCIKLGVRGEIRTRNNAALDRTRLSKAHNAHEQAVRFQLRHPNIGGQSRIRTSEIPKGYRVYSAALSASQPTAQTRNCQRAGGRQATRTPMSRGTLA